MLISLPVQSDLSLERAAKLLDEFDNYKEEFRDIGCSVDLPKIHSMQHYDQRIRDFGTPDNFDTEYTEHQHISDAKEPYRASNKRDPVIQMLRFVHRRTTIEMKYQYLEAIRLNIINSARPHRCSLGARVENCSMMISSAGEKYGLKNLEVDLWLFLHN